MRICTLLLAIVISTSACGDPRPRKPLDTGSGAATTTSAATKAIDPATAGSAAGKVVLKGEAPARAKIDMAGDPACAMGHAGPVLAGGVVVGKDGALKNVVVRVTKGLEGYKLPDPASPPVLDQIGCLYEPRVLAMRPGTIEIRSSDKTLHNVHATGKANKEFNQGMPQGSPPIKKKFDAEEIVPLKCDVHAWMKAYVFVANTIAVVTSEDGSFKLEGLPPGKYTVTAWHEELGEKTSEVTIETEKTAELNFEF